MEIEELNFAKICRICLNAGKMMSLFKVNMYKKIMACADIQVWPNDGLPSQICTKCASKLHISFQFKKQCEKSDQKLRQYDNVKPIRADEKINDMKIVEMKIDNILHQEPHHIYIQNNGNQNFDNFMTAPQNTQPITQVTYNDITNDNQIQVTNFNLPTQMAYDAQYVVANQQMQETPDLHQPIQHQITEQTHNSQVTLDKSSENSEFLNKDTSDKDSQTGESCPTCKKVFKTNRKLSRHMKTHTASRDLPHKCHVCGKGFSHSGNYKIHLRIHSNERPYICPVCNRGCRQAHDLEKHMRIHTGEKPHKCHFCPKAFATSSNLTAHIRTHTGERPYVCCVCQKAFCQSNELTKHMRTHTGEKSHICDICNKGFNGSSGLLAHRRQHTGERPYVCQHCQRGFTSSNCLAAHVKTHNKTNPLQCERCDDSFDTLLALKEHVSSKHAVQEPLQCKVCPNVFDKVIDYVLHVRTHSDAEES